MLTIRVDCERINGRYTHAEYRGKKTRCDLTLNTSPYAGACGGAFAPPLPSLRPPAGLIISKSSRFSPETEFTPVILASKSAPHPFAKSLNSHPHFRKSAYEPEIISSFKIWISVLFLKGHSNLKNCLNHNFFIAFFHEHTSCYRRECTMKQLFQD